MPTKHVFKHVSDTLRRAAWTAVPVALVVVLAVSAAAIYPTIETARRSRDVVARIDRFLTTDRLHEYHAATVHTGDAAQITANAASETLYTLRDQLVTLGPAIDTVADDVRQTTAVVRAETRATGPVVRQTIASTDRLVATTDDVVARNGEMLYQNQATLGRSIDETLERARATIAAADGVLSGPELAALIEDAAATGHAVRLLVDDPDLRRAIVLAAQGAAATTVTSAVFMNEAAGTARLLHRKVDALLFPPPPRTFWGRVGRVLKTTAQWVTVGGSAGYWLIRIAR